MTIGEHLREDHMTIGERILHLREERGLSQRQLGEMLGLRGHDAEMHVQRLEQLQSNLSIKELVQLSDIFDMRIDEFLRHVQLDP